MTETDRRIDGGHRMAILDVETACSLRGMLDLAPRGLATAYVPETGRFAQTVRAVTGPQGVHVQREGTNVRYAAMAALGLARLDGDVQRGVLAGKTAAEVTRQAAEDALDGTDPGAVALAAWAEAEVNGTYADKLFGRMGELLTRRRPALHGRDRLDGHRRRGRRRHGRHRRGARRRRGPADRPRGRARHLPAPAAALGRAALAGPRRLLRRPGLPDPGPRPARGAPHGDARGAGRGQPLRRAHLRAAGRAPASGGGTTTPATARSSRATRSTACTSTRWRRWRCSTCAEAGGDDHTRRGRRAGSTGCGPTPRSSSELVSTTTAAWCGARSAGASPRKAARALAAVTTVGAPGLAPAGRRTGSCPPTVVDHECRPYELGWLLYAWLRRRRARPPAPRPTRRTDR